MGAGLPERGSWVAAFALSALLGCHPLAKQRCESGAPELDGEQADPMAGSLLEVNGGDVVDFSIPIATTAERCEDTLLILYLGDDVQQSATAPSHADHVGLPWNVPGLDPGCYTLRLVAVPEPALAEPDLTGAPEISWRVALDGASGC